MTHPNLEAAVGAARADLESFASAAEKWVADNHHGDTVHIHKQLAMALGARKSLAILRRHLEAVEKPAAPETGDRTYVVDFDKHTIKDAPKPATTVDPDEFRMQIADILGLPTGHDSESVILTAVESLWAKAHAPRASLAEDALADVIYNLERQVAELNSATDPYDRGARFALKEVVGTLKGLRAAEAKP